MENHTCTRVLQPSPSEEDVTRQDGKVGIMGSGFPSAHDNDTFLHLPPCPSNPSRQLLLTLQPACCGGIPSDGCKYVLRCSWVSFTSSYSTPSAELSCESCFNCDKSFLIWKHDDTKKLSILREPKSPFAIKFNRLLVQQAKQRNVDTICF